MPPSPDPYASPPSPYQPPVAAESASQLARPQSSFSCLVPLVTLVGAGVGFGLAAAATWVLIELAPGPGFNLALPLVIAGGACGAVLGSGAGYLSSRRLRGISNRRAGPLLVGLGLVAIGLIGLGLSWSSGPFLTHSLTSIQNPDGSHTFTEEDWDLELGCALTLGGLGFLALAKRNA